MIIFGYFGITCPKHYSRGETIRVGRWTCKVVFSIGKWHWLKRKEK